MKHYDSQSIMTHVYAPTSILTCGGLGPRTVKRQLWFLTIFVMIYDPHPIETEGYLTSGIHGIKTIMNVFLVFLVVICSSRRIYKG